MIYAALRWVARVALGWFYRDVELLGAERLPRAAAAAAVGGRGAAPDPARNVEAFRAVVGALRRGGAVLVFPEGISHDRPELAPLKTGVARLALDAHAEGVRELVIVPIGIIFE